MTDETTDAYAALMAAVESYRSCERLNTTGIPREYREAVRREAERLVIGQQIAVLVECDQYVADAAVVAEISIQLEIARAALAALDGAA